jgi:glycosidase
MAEKFETPEWALTANIYEVNLRQYTADGTFTAFGEELPRLRDMGVDILWFMPITPISKEKRQGALGSYYACSDYTSVNPEFGSLEDFKRLVTTAHLLGFKVLVDWVANHTGWDHTWTKERPEFYKKNGQGEFYEEYGWIDVIDLDYKNEELRKEMIMAMRFWVRECSIDGFRCDMAHLVPLDFWIAARTALDKEKKLFWLAECEEPKYHRVFDATYTWQFLHKAEALYRGEAGVEELEAVLENYDATFPANALRLYFTSNHDENSHSGCEYERLGRGAKALAVFCATWQNSLPLIYSGQEMPNKKRLKFFDKDVIEWNGQFLLHDFYKTLFKLRRENPAMLAGTWAKTMRVKTTADENVFSFLRKHGENEVFVILNFSSTSKLKIQITEPHIKEKYTSIFSGIEIDVNEETVFEMQAWEYRVYTKDEFLVH